ncbi:MAG: type II toxin-antitoxin system YafQ family toxin [Fibromonadaceae bacterium]|nr:type II toxin-antitoxin system YafQ family toxin [Fibromonadaceae bacterium]
MLAIHYEGKMKKQLKLMQKRGKDINKLIFVLNTLANGQILPEKYRDHKLTGNFMGYRECHIEPDWLLIYKIIKERLILVATATGTHSDLF